MDHAMTIVRSGGVATLVALMSAHRTAAGKYDAVAETFGQEMVATIEAYLRNGAESPDAGRNRPGVLPPKSGAFCDGRRGQAGH
jgi:hypothetical protein